MKIIPSERTIAELKERGGEYERQAETADEPIATELREKAKLCQEWIAALRTGAWSS